jgi:hypothetical protein
LINDLRQKRKDVAQQMILDLEIASQDEWRYLITEDEL